jgi:predicted permease
MRLPLDDTIADVRYALRGFRRAPLVAATVVFTVALGLGLVAVAFTFLNMFLFRPDRVPRAHEMFALERPSGDGERAFTRADLDALRRETTIFTDAYAELSGFDIRVEGRLFLVTLTTGNFFQVVGVDAAIGRTLTPADDEPGAGRPVMVLSDRGWDRLFARDTAALGRTVLLNGVPFEVVGVMPDGFRGLAVNAPDYWVPLSTLGHVRPRDRGRESAAGVRIVGRVKPGMSRETAVAALAVWAASRANGRQAAPGAPTIDLVPWRGLIDQPLQAVLVTGPLFFAFGLILLIGCANVTNLLLARGVTRQREIGIRLSLGAGRGRIVRQLMTESLLLALAAAAIGFAVSRAALQLLVNAMTSSWPPEIGNLQLRVPDADWRVILFLAAGAAVSAAFFGTVPALQATRIEPVRTLRGEVVRDARPGRARSVLIGVQVSASALLLICAAVFLRSAFAAAAAASGMPALDTVTVEIPNERTRAALVQAMQTEPLVGEVAASWPVAIAPPPGAIAESAGTRTALAYRFVSPEYFRASDIAVLRGRTFTPGERAASAAVAVVSESTARTLWASADAIGQPVRVHADEKSAPGQPGDPPLESRTFTVVGVVADVAGFRIAPFTRSVVYVPASETLPGTALVARVHGDPERARRAILERLAAIDPAVDQVMTVGWVTRMETYFLQLGFWSTVCLGGLALALTLSGLFSVLSYLVEQRTREIGVRMALGATSRDVVRLVLAQSIRPVGAGLLAGGASAAALSALLLATPAAIFSQLVRVLDPVAYCASLILIMTACVAAASIPAARAARLDPARTLRQE